MKALNTIKIFTLVGALLSQSVFAELSNMKASVTIAYKGGLFSSEPSAEIKKEAVEQARLVAWKKYVSKMSGATKDMYLSRQDMFLDNLSDYVVEVIILDDELDKKAKKYSVVVRASIDESAIASVLRSTSAAGSQNTGDGSYFSFVFVTREVDNQRSFQDKKTNITKSESVASSETKVAISGNNISESSDESSFSKSTTGGSVERKADKITYIVASSQDINAAMSNILSTAGFEIVEYDDVVSECGGTEREVIMEEFSVSDDMSRETRKGAINGNRECEVPLFAAGTLDIGLSDTDPVSGNKRVYVSARAQVWNLEKRLPKKVASVGPVQYSGLGPDAKVAMRNALNLAAEKAANEIVAILNSKGIR